MARAFELDPDVGRRGPQSCADARSVMPAAALHSGAQKMRNVIARLATRRPLTWIDCVSRKDV